MSVFSNRAPRTREVSETYVTAIEELVGSRDPVSVLEATPALLERALGETPVAARGVPEAPGKWSVSEVLRHLADAELVWGYRLRRVLTEARPALEGYDQDEWAERLGYAHAEPDESLALFTVIRHANLRLIRRTTPADLGRVAVHAERGEVELGRLLRHNAGHDLLHLRQIERIQRAIKLPAPG